VPLNASSPIISHSCLLTFTPPFIAHYTVSASQALTGEANQVPPIIIKPTAVDNKSDFGTKSDSPMASSSPNAAAAKMADDTVPNMSDYWNKSTITEAD
jgi:hypothetical protein